MKYTEIHLSRGRVGIPRLMILDAFFRSPGRFRSVRNAGMSLAETGQFVEMIRAGDVVRENIHSAARGDDSREAFTLQPQTTSAGC